MAHDRAFLDNVAEKVWELAGGRLAQFPGNYSHYAVLRAERERLRAKAYEKQQEQIERTEEYIRRTIGGQLARQAQSRRKALERLERAYNEHFNTLWNMVSKAKFPLMRRFFETVASRAKRVYDVANRDADAWLRAVMGPLETQVKEHHLQLKRRLDSIRRIHSASDELEERIAELDQQGRALAAQVRALEREVAAIDAVVTMQDGLPLAANG